MTDDVNARERMAEQDAVIGELSSKLGDARAELANLRAGESFTEWGVRWRYGWWQPSIQGSFGAETAARQFASGFSADAAPVVMSRTVTRTEWREVDGDAD